MCSIRCVVFDGKIIHALHYTLTFRLTYIIKKTYEDLAEEKYIII